MKYLAKILMLISVMTMVLFAACIKDTACNSAVCFNGGQCVDGRCICETGYSGEHCEIVDDGNDNCTGVTCFYGGVCVNGDCECPPNYTGTNCQYEVDPCTGVSCVNGDLDSDCDCNCDDGWIGDDCDTPLPYKYTFIPTPIENVCPTHIGGNREFGSAGPIVTINCTAYIVNDEHIYVDVYFHLIETHPDATAGLYDGDIKIYTAPSGKKIESIVSAIESSANYTDTDIAFDFPTVVGELVDSFKSMASTSGDDLGNCVNDYDAELNIYFNQMTIELVDE